MGPHEVRTGRRDRIVPHVTTEPRVGWRAPLHPASAFPPVQPPFVQPPLQAHEIEQSIMQEISNPTAFQEFLARKKKEWNTSSVVNFLDLARSPTYTYAAWGVHRTCR